MVKKIEKQYTRSTVRRLISIILKLAITGGLAWYLFSEIDLEKSAMYLAGFNVEWGIFALCVLLLLFFLATARWLIYLHALRIPLQISPAFRIYLISQFFGQALPAGVGGDAVRVWLLTKKGPTLGPSASSVILDRLTGLVGVLILITILLPLTFNYVTDHEARIGIGLILVICIVVISIIIGLSFVPHYINKWHKFELLSKLAKAAQETRKTGFVLKISLMVTMLSLIMHLLAVVAVYLLAQGIDVNLSLSAALALIPVVILMSTLPISLAGWGVREGTMIAALQYADIGPSESLALSILFGLSLLTVSSLGGLLWLVHERKQRSYPNDNQTGITSS